MTKLEQMAGFVVNDVKWIDKPESQKDAVATLVKDYLGERNDFIASKLTPDQAVVAQAAANEFDNAEAEDEETNDLDYADRLAREVI